MDIGQLLELGAKAFKSSAGGSAEGLPLGQIAKALSGLLPGSGNNVDLSALIGNLQGGGLAALAQSWLGDGGNAGIGVDDLLGLFGKGSIDQFAGQLGIDPGTALKGLQGAVPEIVDKASSGGSLDAIGGVQGLMGMAGKLFG
ncbi:MAG: YidB family protein [Wenzhouxiangellaceae bacterium]|nr:YidB family protein [Wenzhouxiangellaceae bacterium]